MFKKHSDDFANAHPDIHCGDLPVTLLKIPIIPFNGGLSSAWYMSRSRHSLFATTPAALAEGTRIATEAYRAVFSGALDAPKFFTTFTEADRAVCQPRTSCDYTFQGNESLLTMLRAERNIPTRHVSLRTGLRSVSLIWSPVKDVKDPSYKAGIIAARNDRPLLQLQEGFKLHHFRELLASDCSPCPFHRRMGNGQKFQYCCKRAHLIRQLNDEDSAVYAVNPLGKEEAKFVQKKKAQAKRSDSKFDIFSYVRIAEKEASFIKVNVSRIYVSTIKGRLDTSKIFHATEPRKWDYFGYYPIFLGDYGIMVFGGVVLEETGLLTFEGVTAEQAETLVIELGRVCNGIPAECASVTYMPPCNKKPNEQVMEKTAALIYDNFGVNATSRTDKLFLAVCAYCGSGEEEELDRCSCKTVRYCSEEHQKLHWELHKQVCSARKK